MSRENVAFEMEASQGISMRSFTQTVAYSDFVDGLSTAGTMTLSKKLPAYSIPIGVKVQVHTGFTGDTTAVLSVGTSTTTLVAGVVDADILTTDSTIDVYTAAKTYMTLATFSDTNVPQDDEQTVASNYVLLTVTGGADFTSISAGSLTITVYYWSTVEEGGSS